MLKKRWTIYILVAIMLSLSIGQVYGQSVTELKKKQKAINTEIQKNKENIKQIQNQTKNVSNQIKELDLKMEGAALELDNVEAQLVQLGLDIEVAEGELHEAEENLADQEDLFNQRIRVMYKTGNVGYIEVLLASTDVKDFLSRKDMIQSIAEHDKDLIVFMKEQRDIIDNKKTELEAAKASVEVTKSKLEARKRDLEAATREKENLMASLEADAKKLEQEYDKLNDYAKQIDSQILKLQTISSPYSGGKMAWPVPGYSRITSYYGYRIHPIFKVKKLHTGIDIGAPSGTPVTAASDGTVISTGWMGGYGKAVIIDHGGKIATLYAHNSSILVSEGTQVKRGDVIAKVGSTGNSTGPHLHFEVRKNGSYVDPIPWLKGN